MRECDGFSIPEAANQKAVARKPPPRCSAATKGHPVALGIRLLCLAVVGPYPGLYLSSGLITPSQPEGSRSHRAQSR